VEKELRGLFISFALATMVRKHGVEELKIEADGRMFPVSNSSQTIIDCFLKATKKLGISVLTWTKCNRFSKEKEWSKPKQKIILSKVNFSHSSNPKVWEMLQNFGHAVISPVPSPLSTSKIPE
jgi:predicted flavoprotein YhiN